MVAAIRGTILCACLGFAGSIAAQDLDTAIFSGKRQTTILDDIQDRGERKAFLKIFRERNPKVRRSLATKFLADYPASWLLAEVYEIAAKACIDLNDDSCALDMAGKSLSLLPENPLLLVPLATVQLQS